MNIETAKKAIDYTIEHCGERISITFYGGEPLLISEVIKDSIEYALDVAKNKEITFSIT